MSEKYSSFLFDCLKQRFQREMYGIKYKINAFLGVQTFKSLSWSQLDNCRRFLQMSITKQQLLIVLLHSFDCTLTLTEVLIWTCSWVMSNPRRIHIIAIKLAESHN